MDLECQGIAPLDRASNKNHKILKFPILRASVKAYQNNLNTHKVTRVLGKKDLSLEKKNRVSGLELTDTLKAMPRQGLSIQKF